MVRVLLGLLFLAIVPSVSAHAEELRAGIARCAVIEGLLERAECYDAVARTHGLDGPQAISPTSNGDTGDWLVREDVNPIDDSRRVVLVLEAESGKARFGQPVRLVARCQSDKTEVYINWHDYLGDDSSSVYEEWKYVTERVGERTSIRRKWTVSTDNSATFAPNSPIALLKQIATVERFVAQVTPHNESPVTAIFRVTGLRQALVPLAAACNWSL